VPGKAEGCGPVAVVIGEALPAMSISYVTPTSSWDSGFVVFFSEFDPELEDDPTPSELVCLNCLIADGDEQLGYGLDLAREHGQVDWDPDQGEWFVPLDAGCAEP
jgi:hypothetical protein